MVCNKRQLSILSILLRIATLIVTIFLPLTSDPGLWVSVSASTGNYPSNCKVGGTEGPLTTYIARRSVQNELAPGKAIFSWNVGFCKLREMLECRTL